MADIKAGVNTGPGFGADPKHQGSMPTDLAGAVKQSSLDNLAKIGGTVLERIAKRQQEEAFVDGMVRASVGETTAAREHNPELVDLLGTPAAALGARVGEAQRLSTEYLTGLQQQMPELRKLGQEEFSRKLSADIRAISTGDPSTDLVVQQRLVQTLPDVTRQWSRENAEYTQEQYELSAHQALRGEVQEAASYLKNALSSPASADAGSVENRTARLTSAGIAPPGIKQDKHEALWAQEITAAVADGNLPLYRYLKDNGILSAMVPQQRARAEAAGMVAAKQRAEEVRAADRSWDTRYVHLSQNSYKDPKGFDKEVEKLNREWATTTGIPRDMSEFVDPDDYRRMLGAQEADKRRAEAEARRDAKEEARERKRAAAAQGGAQLDSMRSSILLSALQSPNVGQAKALATDLGMTVPEQRQVALGYIAGAPLRVDGQDVPVGSPAWGAAITRRAQTLTTMQNSAPETLQSEIRAALENPSWGRNEQVAMAVLGQVRPEAAAAFLPAHLQNLHKVYQGVVAGAARGKDGQIIDPPEKLWRTAQLEALRTRTEPLQSKEARALGEQVRNRLGLPDNPSAAMIVNDAVSSTAKLAAFTPEEKLDRAIASVEQRYLKFGEWVVVDGELGQGRNMKDGLKPGGARGALGPEDSAAFSSAFGRIMTRWQRKLNSDPRNLMIARPPDRGGAVFEINGATANGDEIHQTITADAVWAEVAAQAERDKVVANRPKVYRPNPTQR